MGFFRCHPQKVCHDTSTQISTENLWFSHTWLFDAFEYSCFFPVAVANPFFRTFEHWPVIKLARICAMPKRVLPRNKQSRICYLRIFFSKKELLPKDRSENWNSKNSNWNSKQLSLLPLRHGLAFCIGQAPNEISV